MKLEEIIKKNFPFENFRPNQMEIITDIIEALDVDCSNFVLESPTGIGKSVISYTSSETLLDLNKSFLDNHINEEFGPPILILTSTRQLQLQYIESFHNQKDFNHLWSAKNYECPSYPDKDDENKKDRFYVREHYFGGPLCDGIKCMNAPECKYLIQKEKFMNSKVGVTNYAYYMANCSLKPVILICDEAHNLEHLLCDKGTFKLSIDICKKIKNDVNRFSNNKIKCDFQKEETQLNKLYKVPYKFKSDNFHQMYDDINKLAETHEKNISNIIKKINNYIDRNNSNKQNTSIKYKQNIHGLTIINNNLEELQDKLNMFIDHNHEWIFNFQNNYNKFKKENETFIEVKPLLISKFFRKYFSSKMKKGIFMSATICGVDQFCKELGIIDYEFKQTNTTIPIENRTVHAINNIGKLNYKNRLELMPKFITHIDSIIEYLHKKHDKNINGIIHTVSYDNANMILSDSKYSKKMLIPNKDDLLNLNEVLKDTKYNIIVSPSIIEGVDLIDELSRFQIFLKVPYLFMGDNWVSHKLKMNNKWYSRKAIVKLVQGCGRSIRSDKDWAETFILDSAFGNLLKYNIDLFPRWFIEAVKTYN